MSQSPVTFKHQDGSKVAFDITAIALLVKLLCAGSNDGEKETWSWRMDKMFPMREVVFFEIWTHDWPQKLPQTVRDDQSQKDDQPDDDSNHASSRPERNSQLKLNGVLKI